MVRPQKIVRGKDYEPVLAGVADKAVRSTDQGRNMPPESIRARAFKPTVILPLFVGAAIAGAALPLLIGYAPFGHRAIERQIDREDRSLCERFELQRSACTAALVDLRHRRELVVLY
jgi:hypothetical protein